jgi:methionine-rich copper-binding protein CopC
VLKTRIGRALARTTVAAALLTALTLTGTTPASAHDQLLSSTPGDGEHLDDLPETIRLEFSGDLLQVGAVVVLADTGTVQTWRTDDPTLDGPVLTTPVPDGLGDGAYEVRWRVVSSDGHAISGAVPFTVGDVPTPTASAPSAPTEPPAGPPSGAATTAEPSAPSGAERADGADAGPWRTVLIGAGGAAGAVALYALVLAVRRRDRRTPSPDDVD